MPSLIERKYTKLFRKLRDISLFCIIRKKIPSLENTDNVDLYVIAFLTLSIFFFWFFSTFNLSYWGSVAVFIGIIRVYEIFIYQINVLLFDEKPLFSPRRTVLHLINNYLEIIFWFALLYHEAGGAFENTSEANFNQIFVYLNFSFFMMTTFGNNTLIPIKDWSLFITFIQSIIGLFMGLFFLSWAISLLSTKREKPKKRLSSRRFY